jgi:hypothetical protein
MELHTHLRGTTLGKKSAINMGHLKMLYIRCLIINECPDVVDILISWLIEVSDSVDDLIIKLFQPIDDKIIIPGYGYGYFPSYPIRDLQISSKKSLYYANVKHLQETGIVIKYDMPVVWSTDAKWSIYRQFWLKKSNVIIDSDWIFGHLLLNSIELDFVDYKP